MLNDKMLHAKKIVAVTAALVMGLSLSVFADTKSREGAYPPDTIIQEIAQLQRAKKLAERNEKDWSEDVLTQADFDEQEKSIDRLTSRLQAGHAVSSDEIHQAIIPPTTRYLWRLRGLERACRQDAHHHFPFGRETMRKV
jgi:hypothetical protein